MSQEISRCTQQDYNQILGALEDFWDGRETRPLHHPMFIHEFGDSAFVIRDGAKVVAYPSSPITPVPISRASSFGNPSNPLSHPGSRPAPLPSKTLRDRGHTRTSPAEFQMSVVSRRGAPHYSRAIRQSVRNGHSSPCCVKYFTLGRKIKR